MVIEREKFTMAEAIEIEPLETAQILVPSVFRSRLLQSPHQLFDGSDFPIALCEIHLAGVVTPVRAPRFLFGLIPRRFRLLSCPRFRSLRLHRFPFTLLGQATLLRLADGPAVGFDRKVCRDARARNKRNYDGSNQCRDDGFSFAPPPRSRRSTDRSGNDRSTFKEPLEFVSEFLCRGVASAAIFF